MVAKVRNLCLYPYVILLLHQDNQKSLLGIRHALRDWTAQFKGKFEAYREFGLEKLDPKIEGDVLACDAISRYMDALDEVLDLTPKAKEIVPPPTEGEMIMDLDLPNGKKLK